MPLVKLYPHIDVSNSPAWTISSGSDVWAMLDDNDNGHVTSDGSDIEATASGKICIIGFYPPVEYGISGFGDGWTNSLTAVVKHNNRNRGASYTIRMSMLDSSNNEYGPGGGLYVEDVTQNAYSSWITTTFTTRTTSDGSSAWTGDDVNLIRMKIHLTAHTGGTTGVTWVYYILDYTEPAAVTDNAVFFGANF